MTSTATNGVYHHNGQTYPRVSTILGVIAAPGLDAWRHRIGLDEAHRLTEAAATLGTRIHAACERWAVNQRVDPILDAGLLPYVQTYRRWFDQHIAKVEAVEQFVVHERAGYAGTADLIAILRDGRRALIDLKTGSSRSGTWPLQLAAYALALEAMDGVEVAARIVVHMPSKKPGKLTAIEYDDTKRDDLAWLAAVRLWRYTERHKDDWKQGGR